MVGYHKTMATIFTGFYNDIRKDYVYTHISEYKFFLTSVSDSNKFKVFKVKASPY